MSGEVQPFTVTYPASPGEVYAPGCLDSQIGKSLRVTKGGDVVEGVLDAATVAPDGMSVTLTVTIPAGFLSSG